MIILSMLSNQRQLLVGLLASTSALKCIDHVNNVSGSHFDQTYYGTNKTLTYCGLK